VKKLLKSHPIGIYDRARGHAKVRTALCLCVTAPWLWTGFGDVAEAQTTHVIRLEVDLGRDVHRFLPARLTARAGDVIVFRVTSGAPHAIAFEPAGLSVAARAALRAALPGSDGSLQGPVLVENNTEYRMVVPRLPAGTYRFYSSPHRAYDMRGELTVK
jgi:plastocyanin